MKYIRRGTPKAPAPAGKKHTPMRNPIEETMRRAIAEPVATPQPTDDADQHMPNEATLIEAVKLAQASEKTVKPVKGVKKPDAGVKKADASRESVKKTDTKTRASKPAKKK